jgi:hypothetical protein
VSVSLTLGSSEDVSGGDQFHIDKSSLLNGIQVLSLQESAANSSGPEVYVGFYSVWHHFMHHNVRQVKAATRLQYPKDLSKDLVLVRA